MSFSREGGQGSGLGDESLTILKVYMVQTMPIRRLDCTTIFLYRLVNVDNISSYCSISQNVLTYHSGVVGNRIQIYLKSLPILLILVII